MLSVHLSLGTAIGVFAIGAYGVAVLALLFLPETRGTDIGALKGEVQRTANRFTEQEYSKQPL
jgi:hypothetical protein